LKFPLTLLPLPSGEREEGEGEGKNFRRKFSDLNI